MMNISRLINTLLYIISILLVIIHSLTQQVLGQADRRAFRYGGGGWASVTLCDMETVVKIDQKALMVLVERPHSA